VDIADLAALRLDLTNQGVRLGDDLLAAGFGLAFSDSNEPAEGLDLILPGDWWTNVCVAPGYARTSPYELVLADGRIEPTRLVLRHRSKGDIPVTVPSTSRFRHATTHTGVSCGDIGAIHGKWLVIAPIAAREGIGLNRPRRFLGVPPQRALTKSMWAVDDVVACAEAAWHLGGARLVHLEAGHLLREDGGVADLTPYITALHRALPTLVSVSVLPPENPSAVLDLYAAGCDAISYHLLAWDEAAASRVAPVRARFVPHARLLTALHEAARIFPAGAVSTDLLIGLEPLTNVAAAVTELVTTGVIPNLALFRPVPGAEDDAPHGEMVPTEPLLAVMAERQRRIAATPLWHSRVRGFARTLSGFDRYSPTWSDRCYASLRRSVRVTLPEASA